MRSSRGERARARVRPGARALGALADPAGALAPELHFLKGWFRDTLPTVQGHQWAVIRLDGDLDESTMDSLENLYPSLS
ncbi:MAG: hypothetical protein H0T61_11675, partial [Actinobacteria bacterium]|nr:hypothetical protein [Actinomycetota bacterium]